MNRTDEDGFDIECEGLVRVFTSQGVEVQALQGLDLTVSPGELVAVVGASGSGKSTLLNILAGHDSPTAGRAVLAGRNLTTMRPADWIDYRRRSVGFVWQRSERNLLPYLDARQNLAAVQALAGVVPRRERGAAIDQLLDLVGVAAVADRRPGDMSGVHRQRLAIAVALANRPRVLLADEPTGSLDETSSADLLSAMQTVNRERGVTTLIVTHDVAVAEHVDRTVRIHDGRTATETLRRTETDAGGRRIRVAEEYATVDRRGRMQFPPDFVDALQLRERVRLSLQSDHAQVRPAQARPRTDTGPRDEEH